MELFVALAVVCLLLAGAATLFSGPLWGTCLAAFAATFGILARLAQAEAMDKKVLKILRGLEKSKPPDTQGG